jgi:hypothetical protein
MVAAAGPLASATLITIGVETQVGTATGLPNAAMLPASLEGLGAVALAYLVTVRPVGAMRWWSVALIGATLAAGMAAQGSHALWFDERTHVLELPWRAKLFVSFVPPASGAAALHLVVKMAEGLIAAVRQLQALPPALVVVEPGDQVADVGRAPAAPELAAATSAPERALVEPGPAAPSLPEPEPERPVATVPAAAPTERAKSAITAPTARAERPERAVGGSAPSGRAKSARSPRPQRAASTAPKRLPAGARHDQVRALLAEPGGRALTGEEIAARLGIDAGYARRLRAEVTDAESAPSLAMVATERADSDEGAPRPRREPTAAATAPRAVAHSQEAGRP